MVFCKACARDVPGIRGDDGFLSCSRCGKVLKFENYSSDVTFVKNAAGQSQLAGRFVRSIQSESDSRQRLYERAREDLTTMKNGLGMGENMAMVDEALRYYKIAVERNFTKGRRTEQVQAACLYIACRENRTPYLLIDFSNYLKINVYVLGAVFLQLCKVLNLTEHPICQKLLDPSIFIHKYTVSLAGGKNKDISKTALTIIASMNREWMQTGRRPSGIWGSALYISALAHGLSCTKEDILQLVHVCEATLSKRLVEFENTDSGSLTIEELNAKAEELKESAEAKSQSGLEKSSTDELLCEHKGTGKLPFKSGICKDCYEYFIGYEGGSDPPAFQRAERQRMEKLSGCSNSNDPILSDTKLRSHGDESLQSSQPETGGPATRSLSDADNASGKMHVVEDTSYKVLDDADTLSDIDDAEVDGYLNTEEEKVYKTIIWEDLNREYLEEQAAKEAAAAAAKEARDAIYKNCPEELQAAMDLEASAAAAVAKSKKERQQKRAAEARNMGPPKSAAEATYRMLTKKRLSSKVNYEALKKLFDESGMNDSKKMRTETHSDNDDELRCTDNEDKAINMDNDDGLGIDNEDDAGEAYDGFYGNENEDDADNLNSNEYDFDGEIW